MVVNDLHFIQLCFLLEGSNTKTLFKKIAEIDWFNVSPKSTVKLQALAKPELSTIQISVPAPNEEMGSMSY